MAVTINQIEHLIQHIVYDDPQLYEALQTLLGGSKALQTGLNDLLSQVNGMTTTTATVTQDVAPAHY